jgi:asparagine synthase (glutamine-hydrolysing)
VQFHKDHRRCGGALENWLRSSCPAGYTRRCELLDVLSRAIDEWAQTAVTARDQVVHHGLLEGFQPAHMLMRVRGKYLLRRAAADLVPRPILRRRKRGFALPLKRWLRHDLKQLTHDVLLDRTARERGLFDPVYVAGIVASLAHGSTQVDRIWTLLMLELWFRAFIDPPRSTSRASQMP